MKFLKKTFDKIVDGGLNTGQSQGMPQQGNTNSQMPQSQVLDELPSLPKISSKPKPAQQAAPPVQQPVQQPQQNNQQYMPNAQEQPSTGIQQPTESTDLLGNFTSQHSQVREPPKKNVGG